MANGSLLDVLESVKLGKQPQFWTSPGIAIIICGIPLGVEFIHSRGMIHRDIKLANILIDEFGYCGIGDLGSSIFVEKEGGDQGICEFKSFTTVSNRRPLSQDKSTVTYCSPEMYAKGSDSTFQR
jgi:serine/threonine protein kinase